MGNGKRRTAFIRIRRCTRGLWRNTRAELVALREASIRTLKDWKRQPLTNLTAAVVSAVLVWWLIDLYYSYPEKDRGQLAAWVQAVGSIGAIASAIFVINIQAKKQIEAQDRGWRKERGRSEKMAISILRSRIVVFSIIGAESQHMLEANKKAIEDCIKYNKIFEIGKIINNFGKWKELLDSIRIDGFYIESDEIRNNFFGIINHAMFLEKFSKEKNENGFYVFDFQTVEKIKQCAFNIYDLLQEWEDEKS